MHRKIIGVIGGSQCTPEVAELAERVGEEIARRGGIIICGGLTGVMEAACRGAKKYSGLTIGILPGNEKWEANPFLDVPIATGMGDARNVIIIRTADAVIAVDGEYGTLSEMAFCLKFNKPLVGLRTWAIDPKIVHANDAVDAVNKAFDLLR